jgi:hypothetical protein
MEERQLPPGLDLLTERLFTIRIGSDIERCTLPGILAALLAEDQDVRFPDLTAEQRAHAWRFFVRCAAKSLHEMDIAVAQARTRQRPVLEADIARVLGGLAPEGAWQLYQSAPDKPGFLQIPTPDGAPPGGGNNYSARSLGLLTSAIGGKDHERKVDVARELTPERTAYAMIEYQLSSVYGGRGNYETQLVGSRSGAGSGVPLMGARIGGSNPESFRHDVRVLLDEWDETARYLGGANWALWALPWDGKSQLGSERLDPAFIPIARMVRLAAPVDGLFRGIWFRPTDTGRVRDHTDGGALGDPLTPLVPDPKTGSPKVRGALRKGYDYTEVVRLLFGSDEQGGTPSPSVQMLARESDDERTDLRVVFEGTAYEQGKTGGFHRREVMLPPNGANYIADPAPVRTAHKQMVERAKDVKGALRGAARILLNGELRPRDGDSVKTEAFAGQLEQRVDASYLGFLWEAVAALEREAPDWIDPWTKWLSNQALEIFRTSIGMLPSSAGRRFEREVSAENYLQYKLAKIRGEISLAGPEQADAEPEPTEEEEEPV